MSSSNMGALILTASQEMELFNDQEVDSMMTLLGNHLNAQQSPLIYNVYGGQETFVQEEQKPFVENQEPLEQNGIKPYPGMLALSPPLMVIPPAVISNEEYGGPLNFEVYIDPHHGSKNPWVYSVVLNKIFITISNAFPVDFKWDPHPANLYVRATPLYSLAQHAQDVVTRCIPHSLVNDVTNRNVPEEILGHILRCQSRNAQYYGDADKNLHYNVLVPLGTPQEGMETVRLMYSFVCKNSCPSGMNRKPFEVVFTLEDDTGIVFGRKKINVRVCSCPKRDKDKEEKDHVKDEPTNGGPPQGKKRKMDKNDKKPPPTPTDTPLGTTEYQISMSVLGKHNKLKVLNYAYEIMAAEAYTRGPTDETYKKYLDTLREQIKHSEST